MGIRRSNNNKESQPEANETSDKELHRMQRFIKAFMRLYEKHDNSAVETISEYKDDFPQVAQWGEDIVAQRREMGDS